jgi:hypothetical protein
MPNEGLCYLPAIELAAAIRTRRLSPKPGVCFLYHAAQVLKHLRSRSTYRTDLRIYRGIA